LYVCVYVGNVDPADVTHPNSVWGLAPRCQQVTVLHEISEGLLHVPPPPIPLPLYMTPAAADLSARLPPLTHTGRPRSGEEEEEQEEGLLTVYNEG
jgi:hypothetical protein